MLNIVRRIKQLEAQRSARSTSGCTIPLSDLDPAVAALLLAHGGEVSQMTLEELCVVETELRRFTV